MEKRDYYEVLGVDKKASADEIKKAGQTGGDGVAHVAGQQHAGHAGDGAAEGHAAKPQAMYAAERSSTDE